MVKDYPRKSVLDLKPGDIVGRAPDYITEPAHRARYGWTVERVTIRHYFNGDVFAVKVEGIRRGDGGPAIEIYRPTARVWYTKP